MAVSAGPHLDIGVSESASETFRFYLETYGVMDKLTSLLGELYNIPDGDRPSNPFDWICERVSSLKTDEVDRKFLKNQLTQLRIENLALKQEFAKIKSSSEDSNRMDDSFDFSNDF